MDSVAAGSANSRAFVNMDMSEGVPPVQPLVRHREGGYVALCVSDDLSKTPGVFGACQHWWAITTEPLYLASPASRRDLWRVLLPLLGIAMSLTTAATGSMGINDHRLIILDVSLVGALLGAGSLPVRSLLSDFAIAVVSAGYLVVHRLLFHNDAALEMCRVLAVLSLGCAGVNALMLAGLLAVSTTAAVLLAEDRHDWSPTLLAVGLFALGLVGVLEHRVASLFADSVNADDGGVVAVCPSRSSDIELQVMTDSIVKDQAVGPESNSSGDEQLDSLQLDIQPGRQSGLYRNFARRQSKSGDSLGYSASGYSSTKSSPMDMAALRGSSPSDVSRPPLPGGRTHPACGIMLVHEARPTDNFSPLSEVSLGLSESGTGRGRQQRMGASSRRHAGVQTTLGPVVNTSMHADKETETTIAWSTEGFFCRRCGLPPSLPKLMGKTSLPRPVGGQIKELTSRSEGSGRSSRSRRSRSSGGSSSDKDKLPTDANMPMVSVFAPVSEETLSLSLEWAMKHWNVPRIPGMCCPWHTVVSVAKKVLKYEVTSQCDPLWSPLTGWQCQHCTGLNHQENHRCDMCFELHDGASSF